MYIYIHTCIYMYIYTCMDFASVQELSIRFAIIHRKEQFVNSSSYHAQEMVTNRSWAALLVQRYLPNTVIPCSYLSDATCLLPVQRYLSFVLVYSLSNAINVYIYIYIIML